MKTEVQRTIILPVLYRYVTPGRTLNLEHRKAMFGNLILQKIFGPKEEEVTGLWRKFGNKLYTLHPSPNIFRMIKS
jgi:hypothetical protein